jgi:hypothetical protein
MVVHGVGRQGDVNAWNLNLLAFWTLLLFESPPGIEGGSSGVGIGAGTALVLDLTEE